MRRRPAGAVLVTLGVLAGCGGGGRTADSLVAGGSPDAEPATFVMDGDGTTPWEPSDAYEALAARVGPDGRLPLDAALSMFALQFGELPGVAVPAGDPGPSRPGDLAIGSVLHRWPELTDDQRVAVREALELDPTWEPFPGAGQSTLDGDALAPAAEEAAAEKTAAEKTAAEEAATGGHRSIAAHRDDTTAYLDSLQSLQEVMERHLGPLGAQVDLVTSRAVVRGGNGEQADAAALLVEPDRCRITVYPAVFPAPSGPHHTLAHELFHCYQQRWVGSPLGAGLAWIEEGTAEWAAAVALSEAGGPVDPALRDWLIEYYATPERPLIQRSYDGVGWFGFLAEQTGALWDRLPTIVRAASSEAGYAGALAGSSGAALAPEWASTQAGRDSHGSRWSIRSPGLPTLDRSQPPMYPILRNGATQSFTAAAYATAQGSAALEANLTKFNAIPPTVGFVRIGNQDRPLSELTGTTWCTDPDGRCTCPPGTARAGQSFPRLEGTEALVAAGAAEQAASLTVQGASLEDECGSQGICPIGKWQMGTLPTGLPYVVDSGGTGTILTVDETGLLTQDFSEYVPLWAHDEGDPGLRTYMAPSGFVTAHVGVPTGTERISDEPVRDPDPSGLGGTGRVEYRGQVSLELTAADMQATALAAEGFGEVLLSCVDDDTLTLSGGGMVHTYQRLR